MRVESILAPNPGPYTGKGTNTYLLESAGEVVVVDPGPVDKGHQKAIEDAVADRSVIGVAVTHTHLDHAPLANPLSRRFGVPALGYAPGPEFVPDRVIAEGDRVRFGSEDLHVLYTPGHADDHVCFLVRKTLFTGDHIMGGSTVMVEDLTRYLSSLRRLQSVEVERMYPGHGPEIVDPAGVIDYYIDHRLEREQEIVEAIERGAGTVGAVVTDVYSDVDAELHPIAAYSVAAHLRKLAEEGRVAFTEQSAGQLWSALVTMINRRP